MRIALVLLAGLLGVCAIQARDKPATYYGVDPDEKTYPQGSPKEALASVLKAIDAKRIDYLLAHLSDREFVNERVKTYGGNFEELVKETSAKLAPDSAAVKQLRRFLSDGEWEIGDASATVKLKDVTDRRVYLRKGGGSWFLENAMKKDEK